MTRTTGNPFRTHAAALALAALALAGCSSTGSVPVGPTYNPAKLDYFDREAKKDDTVHVTVAVEPTDLLSLRKPLTEKLRDVLEDNGYRFVATTSTDDEDPTLYHCQVFLRYLGPLGEENRRLIYEGADKVTTTAEGTSIQRSTGLTADDVRGGLKGWFPSPSATDRPIDGPTSPPTIPMADTGGLLGRGSGANALVIDVSVGERIEASGPTRPGGYVRRTFRIVGTKAAANREDAIMRFFYKERPPHDTGQRDAEGNPIFEEQEPELALDELAQALVAYMVPPPSPDMLIGDE